MSTWKKHVSKYHMVVVIQFDWLECGEFFIFLASSDSQKLHLTSRARAFGADAAIDPLSTERSFSCGMLHYCYPCTMGWNRVVTWSLVTVFCHNNLIFNVTGVLVLLTEFVYCRSDDHFYLPLPEHLHKFVEPTKVVSAVPLNSPVPDGVAADAETRHEDIRNGQLQHHTP